MSDVKTDFEEKFPARIAKDPAKSAAIGAVFLFKISGDEGGTWTLNLKDDPGVKAGEHPPVDCTLEMTAEDWRTINTDPSAAMKLFFTGKLKVTGNAMLATKLQQFLGG
jgi:putative sterol carrier protein